MANGFTDQQDNPLVLVPTSALLSGSEQERVLPAFTRRQWLQLCTAGVVGLWAPQVEAQPPRLRREALPQLNQIADVGGMLRSQGINKPGRVIEVRHNNVFPLGGYSPDRSTVDRMLSVLLTRLTGESTSQKAWTRMVGAGDKVGILVDANGGAARHTRKALIDSILVSLRRAGVKANDIIVWCAYGRQLPTIGYNLNWKRPGIKFLGADQMGYDKRYKFALGGGLFGSASYLSKIVTQSCTHIINISTLEDHPILGCHLCLAQQVISSMSGGRGFERYWGGARGIGRISAWPIMRQRFMLHLIDGLAGTYNGALGPWKPQALFGGTDAVAVDRVGFAYIDSKRRIAGVPVITGTRRTPVHINHAALQGAGIANMQQIKHQKIMLK